MNQLRGNPPEELGKGESKNNIQPKEMGSQLGGMLNQETPTRRTMPNLKKATEFDEKYGLGHHFMAFLRNLSREKIDLEKQTFQLVLESDYDEKGNILLDSTKYTREIFIRYSKYGEVYILTTAIIFDKKGTDSENFIIKYDNGKPTFKKINGEKEMNIKDDQINQFIKGIKSKITFLNNGQGKKVLEDGFHVNRFYVIEGKRTKPTTPTSPFSGLTTLADAQVMEDIRITRTDQEVADAINFYSRNANGRRRSREDETNT